MYKSQTGRFCNIFQPISDIWKLVNESVKEQLKKCSGVGIMDIDII